MNSELFMVLLAFHSFSDVLNPPSTPDLLPAAFLCKYKLSSMFHIFLHLVTSASVNRTFDDSTVLQKLQWTCSSAIILRFSKACHLGLSFTPAKHLYCSTSCSLLRTNYAEIKINKNCLKKKTLEIKTKNSFSSQNWICHTNNPQVHVSVLYVPQNCWRTPCTDSSSSPPIISCCDCVEEENGPASSHLLDFELVSNLSNMLFALTTITSRKQIPLGTVAVPSL